MNSHANAPRATAKKSVPRIKASRLRWRRRSYIARIAASPSWSFEDGSMGEGMMSGSARDGFEQFTGFVRVDLHHRIEERAEAEQFELFGDVRGILLAGKFDEERDVAQVLAVLEMTIEGVVETPTVVGGDDDHRVIEFSGLLHRSEKLAEHEI